MTFSILVSSEAEFNAAIASIDVGGVDAGAGPFTITLTHDFGLTSDLLAIDLAAGATLTINGAGHAISGAHSWRGISVLSGVVTINSLDIDNMLAHGGAGGSGALAGGGGAGLGGGLFVAGPNGTAVAGGSVTLNHVQFSGDAAVGGAGGTSSGGSGYAGGGGMGGTAANTSGYQATGGGGFGSTASGGAEGQGGGAGIVPGGASGGSTTLPGGANGGGGAGYASGGAEAAGGGIGGTAPNGGFGGGGGGGLFGGNGGFGGGGGGSTTGAGAGGFGGGGSGGHAGAFGTQARAGGFGAGAGTSAGGGGGLAAGGDIFVQQGGTLIIGEGTENLGTVTAGSGANTGSAFGTGMFLQGNETVTLAPASGKVLTLAGGITDQSGSDPGNTFGQPGSGTLLMNGAGTVKMTGANSFTGGILLQAGTLELAAAGAGGSGAVTFTGPATLRVDSGIDTPTVDAFAPGDTILLASKPTAASFSYDSAAGQIVYPGHTITLGGQAGVPSIVYNPSTGAITVTSVVVGSGEELSTAIAAIDAAPAGSYDIALGQNFTLDADLNALVLPAGVTLTIDGAGHTIDGGYIGGSSGHRGFFVFSGDVTIENLRVANAVARGGNGGSASQAGGGGAGLGGGLFVAGLNVVNGVTLTTGGTVALANVIFFNDRAVGGNGGTSNSNRAAGGGGGMGGNGGSGAYSTSNPVNGGSGINGGGGGVGLLASGGDTSGVAGGAGILRGVAGPTSPAYGGAGGANGGGGGGNAHATGTVIRYASYTTGITPRGGGGGAGAGTDTNGGFGGGGGGAQNIHSAGGMGGFGGGGGGSEGGAAFNGTSGDIGGAGGWGGGGGGGFIYGAGFSGGAGGFGGGSGYFGGGGGGLGAGADVFVQQGGSLRISSGVLVPGFVAGGKGAYGYDFTSGAGLGSGLFLQGTQSATLDPGIHQTMVIEGDIADDGHGSLVVNGGGRVMLSGSNSFAGGISVSNAILELTNGGAGGVGTITLGGSAELWLDGTTYPSAPISLTGSLGTDTIDLTGLVFAPGATAVAMDGTLEVISNGVTAELALGSIPSGTVFQTMVDDGIGTAVVACYRAGTRIAVPGGERSIESLRIGDAVATPNGPRRLKWIGRRSFAADFVAAHPEIGAICIRRFALDDLVPARDVFVSPQHAILVDGVLIPAAALVNGVSILRAPPQAETYLHLELDDHGLVWAEGMAAETFVDVLGRGMFHNAAEYDALYPGERGEQASRCGVARIEEGAALAAVWARLAARAGVAPRRGPAGGLEGDIRRREDGVIEGWAWDPARPDRPVEVAILMDGTIRHLVVANRYRSDLYRAGLAGGRCGFTAPGGGEGVLAMRRVA